MPRHKKADIEKIEREQQNKAQSIIAAVAANTTLTSACAQEKVATSTFFDWLEKYGLSEQYARARGMRADLIFEGMFDLDEQLKTGQIDSQTHRALTDSLKWRLGKMAGKYNDKQQIDLTSSDRSMSPVHGDLSHLSYDQIYALAKKMNGQAKSDGE